MIQVKRWWAGSIGVIAKAVAVQYPPLLTPQPNSVHHSKLALAVADGPPWRILHGGSQSERTLYVGCTGFRTDVFRVAWCVLGLRLFQEFTNAPPAYYST